MPRPKDGYKNAADQPIPGTHDITGRYKEMGGLMNWAYSQGKKGVPLYGREFDIGTAVHRMAELDLRGANPCEIERIPFETLQAAEHIDMAHQAFGQFRDWRKQHDVRAVSLEESIVSERWQYGGTLDHVLRIDGVRGLFDLKTCKTAGQVYLEQRIVLSAHGNLWREKHPDLPLDGGYHLIMLPKDGSKFGHHAFADLSPEWQMFTLQLDCWRIEKGLASRRTVSAGNGQNRAETVENGQAVDPTKSLKTADKTVKKRSKTAKPSTETKIPTEAPALAPPPMEHLSMAEILRRYHKVPEAA